MSHAKDRLFNDWKTKEVAYRAYLARELATYSGMRRRQRGFIINPYSFGGPATDPYFANVRLLLHMDGSDGGTTFTDSSSFAHSVTRNGTAITTITSNKKYGTASANANIGSGNSNYLSVADTTNLEFGGSDFCIEGWTYWNSGPSNGNGNMVWSAKGGTPNYEHLFYGVGGAANALTLYLFYSSNGTSLSNVTPGSFTVSAGSWTYITCDRNGSNVRFFVNGTQLGSTQTVSATFYAGSDPWRCYTWAGGSSVVNANNDDIRITVGQSRYTANFTPPTAAHPDS